MLIADFLNKQRVRLDQSQTSPFLALAAASLFVFLSLVLNSGPRPQIKSIQTLSRKSAQKLSVKDQKSHETNLPTPPVLPEPSMQRGPTSASTYSLIRSVENRLSWEPTLTLAPTHEPTTTLTPSPSPLPTATATPTPRPKADQPLVETLTPSPIKPKSLVTLQIVSPAGTSSFSLELNEDRNLCDLLVEARDQGKIQSLTLDNSYLQTLKSPYIYEINGYKNGWTVSVNGTFPLGCSLYIAKSGDAIIWKYL